MIRRKKNLLIWLSVVALLVVLTLAFGCVQKKGEQATESGAALPFPNAPMPKTLAVKGMSSPGSGYDLIARPMIFNIEANIPGIAVQHVPGGTKAAYDRVESGECQIGVAYVADAIQAWLGVGDYDKPYRHIRTLFQYAPVSGTFLIVPKDSKIMGLKDLGDKRVHLGVAGWSTTRYSLPAALAVHGITPESIKAKGGFVYIGAMDAAIDMMSSGKLDAVCIAAINPSGLVTNINTTQGIRILSLTEEEALAWSKVSPGYVPVELPEGLYAGQETWPDPTPTIEAYVGHVCVRDDLPDEVVYNLLWAIFKDKGQKWSETHAMLGKVDMVKNALYKDWCPIPLHPGAEKFWKDMGFEIPKPWSDTWTKENWQKKSQELAEKYIKEGFRIIYKE